MNYVLVISSLGAGGAERVMTDLANWWVVQGHHVTVITLSEDKDFYQLSGDVERVRLGGVRRSANILIAMWMFILRLYRLRVAIRRANPDSILSFIDKINVLSLIASIGLDSRVIVSERTNPEHYKIHKLWALLRDLIYRRSSILVVQTESLRDWAQHRIAPSKVRVIPNSIDAARLRATSDLNPDEGTVPWSGRIISMGRMSYEKGHDLLLEACAKVLPHYSGWGLEIIGDGPLRSQLALQAHDLGIEQKVRFHGTLSQPFGLIKAADIFVLPSRVEGFPNVLLEAMSLGCAVVSFDCPSGPSELISHKENGLLVSPGNADALAQAIISLINDPVMRSRIGQSAVKIMEQYSEPEVMAMWDEVMR